jgi:hypothetical protein
MSLQSTISFYACCNSARFPSMAEFVADLRELNGGYGGIWRNYIVHRGESCYTLVTFMKYRGKKGGVELGRESFTDAHSEWRDGHR